MNNPSKLQKSESAENFKAIGLICVSAGLGVLLAYASAKSLGSGITLIVILLLLFSGLALSSTVVEAMILTIIFAVLGYVALNLFPQLLPLGGTLCGIAMTMAFAAYKERKQNICD